MLGGTGYFGAGADLKDGFYQFLVPQLGEFFIFDFQAPMAAFGDFMVRGADGNLFAVSGDTVVWPCFEGLAVGWSWSLYFCQAVTADCLRVA